MTPTRDLTQSQLMELSWLNTSSGFLQKRNFSECRGINVPLRDVSRDFFRRRWASPSQFNLALVGWPFYNSKSFTQEVSRPIWKKNKEDFSYLLKALDRAPYLANAMARPPACCSPCQNPLPAGKDKLAGDVPTEDSSTPTPTPIVSHDPNLAPSTAPAATPSLDTELFKEFMKAYLED